MFSFRNYLCANSLEEAYEELIKNKKNIILGGTSFLRLGNGNFNTAIDLSSLSLDYIKEEDEYIRVGAMTNFRSLETSEVLKNLHSGVISKCVKDIIGVQLRNNVTVGATVFSKYGFSDLIPVLLALDTKVILFEGGEISLEDFMNEGKVRRDILVEIKIGKKSKSSFQCVKKSRTDYSIINLCVSKIEDKFRVVIGARPARAILSYGAMEILNSNKIDEATVESACEKMASEVSFGDNMRGTAKYREMVAKNLLKRAIGEVL